MLPHYENLYVEFLYYFNTARDYFECHEVMEELWLEEGRSPLLQGLLQVAVGLYHHGNGNVSGAIKLLTAALEKLEPQPDDALGIDLGLLRKQSAEYVAKLHRIEAAPFEPYDLDIVILDRELERLVEAMKANPPQKEEN